MRRSWGNGSYLVFSICALLLASTIGTGHVWASDRWELLSAKQEVCSCSEPVSMPGYDLSDALRYDLKGGGGEVPYPFGLNEKAELADGELYLLVGRFVILANNDSRLSRAFFDVDLSEQPWLASRHRRINPLYPIDGPVENWVKYSDGKAYRFPCRAVGRIVNWDNQLQYVLFLQGLNPGAGEGGLLRRHR